MKEGLRIEIRQALRSEQLPAISKARKKALRWIGSEVKDLCLHIHGLSAVKDAAQIAPVYEDMRKRLHSARLAVKVALLMRDITGEAFASEWAAAQKLDECVSSLKTIQIYAESKGVDLENTFPFSGYVDADDASERAYSKGVSQSFAVADSAAEQGDEYVVANVRSWGERSANSADWIKFQSERVGHSLLDGRFWQVSLQSATRFDNAADAQAVADAYVADYPRKKVEVVALADADDDANGYAIADSAAESQQYAIESDEHRGFLWCADDEIGRGGFVKRARWNQSNVKVFDSKDDAQSALDLITSLTGKTGNVVAFVGDDDDAEPNDGGAHWPPRDGVYVVAEKRNGRTANTCAWILSYHPRTTSPLLVGKFWTTTLDKATRFYNRKEAEKIRDEYLADYPRAARVGVEVVRLDDDGGDASAYASKPYAKGNDAGDNAYAIADSACELAEYESESAADIARDFEGELVDECIHPIRSAKKPFSATQRKAKRDIYAKAMRRFRASGHLYEEKLIRDGEYFKYSEFANRDCVADSATEQDDEHLSKTRCEFRRGSDGGFKVAMEKSVGDMLAWDNDGQHFDDLDDDGKFAWECRAHCEDYVDAHGDSSVLCEHLMDAWRSLMPGGAVGVHKHTPKPTRKRKSVESYPIGVAFVENGKVVKRTTLGIADSAGELVAPYAASSLGELRRKANKASVARINGIATADDREYADLCAAEERAEYAVRQAEADAENQIADSASAVAGEYAPRIRHISAGRVSKRDRKCDEYVALCGIQIKGCDYVRRVYDGTLRGNEKPAAVCSACWSKHQAERDTLAFHNGDEYPKAVGQSYVVADSAAESQQYAIESDEHRGFLWCADDEIGRGGFVKRARWNQSNVKVFDSKDDAQSALNLITGLTGKTGNVVAFVGDDDDAESNDDGAHWPPRDGVYVVAEKRNGRNANTCAWVMSYHPRTSSPLLVGKFWTTTLDKATRFYNRKEAEKIRDEYLADYPRAAHVGVEVVRLDDDGGDASAYASKPYAKANGAGNNAYAVADSASESVGEYNAPSNVMRVIDAERHSKSAQRDARYVGRIVREWGKHQLSNPAETTRYIYDHAVADWRKASAIISKMADDDNAKTAEIKKRLSSVETTLARVRRDAFSLRDIDLPNPKANDFWVQDERMTGILNAKDASEQEYPLNSRNNSHIINPNLYDSAAERNSIWQILSSRSATDKAINDLEDAAAEAREKSERFSDKANDYWEKVGSPEIVFNVRKAAHYQKLEDGAEAAWSKQDEFDYAAFRLRRIYLARNGDADARRDCINLPDYGSQNADDYIISESVADNTFAVADSATEPVADDYADGCADDKREITLLKARLDTLEKNDRANIERISALEGEVANLKSRLTDLEN